MASDHLSAGTRIFGPDVPDACTIEQERRRSYLKARQRLEAAGVSLREDEPAWAMYTDLRSRWDAAARIVRAHFGYSLHNECDHDS